MSAEIEQLKADYRVIRDSLRAANERAARWKQRCGEAQAQVERVEALAEPLGDYAPYAVQIDGEVHLAVLVEDLRKALEVQP